MTWVDPRGFPKVNTFSGQIAVQTKLEPEGEQSYVTDPQKGEISMFTHRVHIQTLQRSTQVQNKVHEPGENV